MVLNIQFILMASCRIEIISMNEWDYHMASDHGLACQGLTSSPPPMLGLFQPYWKILETELLSVAIFPELFSFSTIGTRPAYVSICLDAGQHHSNQT